MQKVKDQIEASRAAACHSGQSNASNVLIKSGLSFEDAACTLRLSIGRYTSMQEIEQASEILSQMYNEMKKI